MVNTRKFETFQISGFTKAYRKFPQSLKKKLDKQFLLLAQDEKYPSLQFKKTGNYWSFRIDGGYRALGKELPEGILWFWAGTHDEYERLIKLS